MPAQWTGEIIVQLHMNKISKKMLAEEADMTPEYVSMLLNGHRESPGAEAKLRSALDRIIERKANSLNSV